MSKSALSQMNGSLQRLHEARETWKKAIAIFHDRFPCNSRAVFDRGDMRLVDCTIIGHSEDYALVSPREEDVGPWLHRLNGLVYVPWALLFTVKAAE